MHTEGNLSIPYKCKDSWFSGSAMSSRTQVLSLLCSPWDWLHLQNGGRMAAFISKYKNTLKKKRVLSQLCCKPFPPVWLGLLRACFHLRTSNNYQGNPILWLRLVRIQLCSLGGINFPLASQGYVYLNTTRALAEKKKKAMDAGRPQACLFGFSVPWWKEVGPWNFFLQFFTEDRISLISLFFFYPQLLHSQVHHPPLQVQAD